MVATKFETVEAYLDNQPKETKKKLTELGNIIKRALPDAEELINYDMHAYALVKNGKRDKQIMIAGYKKFVSLYTGTSVLENFLEELKPYKIGKASVQFPLNQSLPKELIIKLIMFKEESIK